MVQLELTDQAFDVDGRVLEVGDIVEDADVTAARKMVGRVTHVHDYETGKTCFVTVHTDNTVMIYVTGRSLLWRWIDPNSLKARSFTPSSPMPVTFDSVR